MNRFQLTVNKSFFILIYSLCVLTLLTGMYVTVASLFAIVGLALASFYLMLSLFERRKVAFYTQGVFYHDLFGIERYIPVEDVISIDFTSYFGVRLTRVNLKDSRLWFFAFGVDNQQITYLKSKGYKFDVA